MATLIVGASGLLGRALHQGLAARAVVGTCHTRRREGLIPLDVRQPDAVAELLHTIRPETVINAVGERRPAVWDRDPHAMRVLNVDAAATIARTATEVGAWLIHISTDYVFDGAHPPYSPHDPPHPINDYGQSKLDAERHVLTLAPTAAILRVPVLYGPVENPDESHVTHIAHVLAHGQPIMLDHTIRRYPTHVNDVTAICDLLLRRRREQQPPSGIWHFSNDEGYTKYEIAQLIAQAHHLPARHLTPHHTPPAGRPGDCRLDTTALLHLTGTAVLPAHPPFATRVATITRPWITAPV